MKSSLYKIGLHLAGWLMFFLLPVLFLPRNVEFINFLKSRQSQASLYVNVFIIIFFYLNAYLLLPVLFKRSKKVFYFLIIAASAVVYYYIVTNMRQEFAGGLPEWVRQNNPRFREMNVNRANNTRQLGAYLIFLLDIFFSSLVYFASRLSKSEKRVLEVESDRKSAELSFLKAQINPHFLFNTLNNIYTLSLTKNEKTPDAIMRLSKIMRYVTSDVQKEMIPLEQELNCVRDFIDLQKLRLSPETVKLEFSIIGDTQNKLIAPLILLPFVENVFKYGISNDKESKICIKIIISENSVELTTENTVFRISRDVESTGVGIENVKRRLTHIYRDKFQLNISNTNNTFTVKFRVPV
jgi:two-component system, LytTR family, sensor kinase